MKIFSEKVGVMHSLDGATLTKPLDDVLNLCLNACIEHVQSWNISKYPY